MTTQGVYRRKIDKLIDGVETFDDAADSLGGVLSEVNDIQEEFNELKEQRENFAESIEAVLPKSRPDNTAVATARTQQIQDSQGATPTPLDEEKGDSPEP
jgi:formiminotetrahydrofolate cyclodeaminase